MGKHQTVKLQQKCRSNKEMQAYFLTTFLTPNGIISRIKYDFCCDSICEFILFFQDFFVKYRKYDYFIDNYLIWKYNKGHAM